MEDFLLNISLVSDNTEIKEEKNAVSLMTIHAVKGLEFPYVFLVGMEENLFPHANSLYSEEELEEERRLCYVAITRCKKKMFITNARIRLLYGTNQVNPISRFIKEIDPDLLDNISANCFEKNEKIDYNNIKEEKVDISKNYDNVDINYQVGDFVYHENFGAGKVLEIIPNLKDPTRTLLKIAFKLPYGVKTLIYSHKNLRKV